MKTTIGNGTITIKTGNDHNVGWHFQMYWPTIFIEKHYDSIKLNKFGFRGLTIKMDNCVRIAINTGYDGKETAIGLMILGFGLAAQHVKK